jgi:hypothetical protein
MALVLKIKEQKAHGNVVVMGAPMSGKTPWVVNTIGREEAVYISTDGNALPGCKVAEVQNWQDLMEAIEYAVGRDDMKYIVLDVLDDAVSFAEQKAQGMLGMSGKADKKGAYGAFVNTVTELVKEKVLRPLINSGKSIYVIMHSSMDKNGVETPSFGSFSSDALNVLHWLDGRSDKVVRCTAYNGTYDVITEVERKHVTPPPIKEVSDDKPAKGKEK